MAADRKRIHITPFNSTLFDRFIPPSLQLAATGISFHTVQTFPERGFGYVELPTMEAEKLKKKFNGTTLKGTKVKIEDAKPQKKRKSEAEAEEDGTEKKRPRREKRKREEGVLEGHELEEGRKVKRGWSEEKKGRKVKGGEEEGRKLRFKTVVPGTAVPVGKEKKAKKKDSKEKKGKMKTVVEEFAKHKVPAVVRSTRSSTKATTEFVEGKGWVDEDGHVVEEATKSSRPRQKEQAVGAVAQVVSEPAAAGEGEEDSSSEVLSSSPDPISSDSDEESVAGEPVERDAIQDAARASASQSTPEPLHDTLMTNTEPPPESKEVHPLEALFKRPAASRPTTSSTNTPRPKPSPIDTSFTFFNSGAPEPEGDDEGGVIRKSGEMHIDLPPQTPHTRQDMEWRAMRSAAPTPDTAAIGKRFSFGLEGEDEEVEEEDGDAEAGDRNKMKEDAGEREEESAFRKWFYENRGDLNRGWKKRRREERKVKRQRENRRMGRRVA